MIIINQIFLRLIFDFWGFKCWNASHKAIHDNPWQSVLIYLQHLIQSHLYFYQFERALITLVIFILDHNRAFFIFVSDSNFIRSLCKPGTGACNIHYSMQTFQNSKWCSFTSSSLSVADLHFQSLLSVFQCLFQNILLNINL